MHWTAHVEQRLLERGISKDEVEEAWNRRVTQPVPGNQPGTLCFTGITKTARRLKIVVVAADQNVIVTAMEA